MYLFLPTRKAKDSITGTEERSPYFSAALSEYLIVTFRVLRPF